MNFDKYEINGELLEIYSDSEDCFSVGKILSKDAASVLFRAYDEQGRDDGLHFVKNSSVREVKSDTMYLKKMQLYVKYWEKTKNIHLINPFKKHPTLQELLQYAVKKRKIITVSCTCNQEELFTGYVEKYDNEKVNMDCIDMETACAFENITLLQKDIYYLEIESLDNELLKYANERITCK